MQIANIAYALKEIAAENPMAAALIDAGLSDPGGIHYGVRASRTSERPFAMLTVAELGRDEESHGVAEVEYEVALQVVCDQQVNLAGDILDMFHRYWDRATALSLPLDPSGEPLADFVSIEPGQSEIGEADEKTLGRDVILGATSWTLILSEHRPSL